LNNRATFKGFTPLHYAILTNNLQLMKILLEAGADPLRENELGHKPHEYCASKECRELLQLHEKKVITNNQSSNIRSKE
jgi:ATP-dependent Clp protease ATP-binding subunit ClpB